MGIYVFVTTGCHKSIAAVSGRNFEDAKTNLRNLTNIVGGNIEEIWSHWCIYGRRAYREGLADISVGQTLYSTRYNTSMTCFSLCAEFDPREHRRNLIAVQALEKVVQRFSDRMSNQFNNLQEMIARDTLKNDTLHWRVRKIYLATLPGDTSEVSQPLWKDVGSFVLFLSLLMLGIIFTLCIVNYMITSTNQLSELQNNISQILPEQALNIGIQNNPSTMFDGFDPWSDVRVCNPTYVNVLLYSGDYTGLRVFLDENDYSDYTSEDFRAYLSQEGGWYYEVWQPHLITSTPLDDTERFHTKLLPGVVTASLEDIPQGFEVKAYNGNGFLGSGNSSTGVSLGAPYRCFVDEITDIEWTPESELELLSTSVITYVNGGFVSGFYVGRSVSQEEVNHLLLDNTYDVKRWIGGGFIGGGSSYANYDILWEDNNAPLVWKGAYAPALSTPRHVVLEDIPLYNEIVIYTARFDDEGVTYTECQRIILTFDGSMVNSLELTEDKPQTLYPSISHYVDVWDAETSFK